jgi:hypothetical protein
MQLNLTDEDTQNIIDALEAKHRDLCEKATGWSYDLEGDFDTYTDLRRKELILAHTINRVKRQRTAKANGEKADIPLADWEVKLLSGGTV